MNKYLWNNIYWIMPILTFLVGILLGHAFTDDYYRQKRIDNLFNSTILISYTNYPSPYIEVKFAK